MGYWEDQLRNLVPDSADVRAKAVGPILSALDNLKSALDSATKDPGIKGEAGDAAKRSFQKSSINASLAVDTIQKMVNVTASANVARSQDAQTALDNLPSADPPLSLDNIAGGLAGAGAKAYNFASSIVGNLVDGQDPGTAFNNADASSTAAAVKAGVDTRNEVRALYSQQREKAAADAVERISNSMDSAARGLPAAPGTLVDVYKPTGPDQPNAPKPGGTDTGPSNGGGYSPSTGGGGGGGFTPTGGHDAGSSFSNYHGPKTDPSAAGNGLVVPLPASIDPTQVPAGHHGSFVPDPNGGDPTVTYHPLPGQPGGIGSIGDSHIRPDGPVGGGLGTYTPGTGGSLGSGFGPGYGTGSGSSGSTGYGTSGGGLNGIGAGIGGGAVMGGAGLASRAGLGGLGGFGKTGASGSLGGSGLGAGSLGGAGGSRVGAGGGIGGTGGARGGLSAGSGGSASAGGAASEAGGAKAGGTSGAAGAAGKGGTSMMGGHPMGGQSGDKNKGTNGLGLVAPTLDDDDDKPVLPPSAGAGGRG